MNKVVCLALFFVALAFAQQSPDLHAGADINNPLSKRRYSRTFNVVNYGAVHDGTTNDSGAVARAIAAIPESGGGVIYFPKGVYSLPVADENLANSGFVITKDSVTIRGAGKGKALIIGHQTN